MDAGGRVRAVEVETSDGSTRRIATDLLVGADGLHSLVARRVGAPVTRQGRHASAFVLQHITAARLDREAYQWIYGPASGAGVIPTNGGAWCVFAAMPPHAFRTARTTPRSTMLEVLGGLDPTLADQVGSACAVGPVRSWPGTPGRFRKPYGPGWALVGDAGYFKDPFAAHGISDALRDAELLARAAVDGDFARYEALRDELSTPLFDVLERIASYEWTLDTVPGLHLQLSRAMRDEDAALRAALLTGTPGHAP
jgi:2-polyprenyl-6-methoxyphenol hydroxylase-like FAD-dependent oxidoreductase